MIKTLKQKETIKIADAKLRGMETSKNEFGSGVVTTTPTPVPVDLELEDPKIEKDARI